MGTAEKKFLVQISGAVGDGGGGKEAVSDIPHH